MTGGLCPSCDRPTLLVKDERARCECGFDQTMAEALDEAHDELFKALEADGWEVSHA